MPRSAVLAVALLLLASPVAAQNASQEFQSWTINCEQDESGSAEHNCQMVQTQNVPDTTEPLMSLVIWRVQAGATAIGILRTPLGARLGDGVKMQIDKSKPFSIYHSICLASGCHASFVLEENLAGLHKGKTITATIVRADADNSEQSVAFSLSGFSRAYEHLLDKDR